MPPFFPRLTLFVLCAAICCGCATVTTSNTARTATEQLLISNAVDQSLDKIDFSTFVGTKVVLEEKYLEGVDKAYVLASVRHRLLYHGATISTDAKDADIILEARSGGIGDQELFGCGAGRVGSCDRGAAATNRGAQYE